MLMLLTAIVALQEKPKATWTERYRTTQKPSNLTQIMRGLTNFAAMRSRPKATRAGQTQTTTKLSRSKRPLPGDIPCAFTPCLPNRGNTLSDKHEDQFHFIKGSVLGSFKVKFILFLGFNFQLRHPVFPGHCTRLRQQLLPEGFTAQAPAAPDALPFHAVLLRPAHFHLGRQFFPPGKAVFRDTSLKAVTNRLRSKSSRKIGSRRSSRFIT